MTALAGWWDLGGSRDPVGKCRSMLAAQQMYGTEDAALVSSGRIAIGCKLFKLLPEDRYGAPLAMDGLGERILCADVRLDNRNEIGRGLGLAPPEIGALSDAAILFRALMRWEEEAVDRLRGDFAFGYWDGQKRRLLLARDFLGQRPLYYHRRENGFFSFASMPKGLHALPEIDRAPDLKAVADFVALMPEDGENTFFEGIRKVAPGHFLIVTASGLQMHRYWQPPSRPVLLKKTADYVEAVRSRFDAAVAARLRRTRDKVAVHLSGGLDSGAVAATAARLAGMREQKIVAFTSAPREHFDPPSGNSISDETTLAAATAGRYPNIEHVVIRAGSGSPLEVLARGFDLYDRPVLNPVNLVWLEAIYAGAQACGTNILLTGARGNAGFSYSGMPLLSKLLRGGQIGRLAQESRALHRNGMRLGTIAAQALGPSLPDPFWKLVQRLRGRYGDISEYTALRAGAVQELKLAQRAKAGGMDLSFRPVSDSLAARLWLLKGVDYGNYNKGALGGWGVDTRDPTADRDLIEFCLAIPDEQNLVNGVTRSIARSAMTDRMADAALRETRKGYQAADWYEGLAAVRENLQREVESISACPLASSILDTERLQKLMSDWPSTGWASPRVTQDYRLVLLRAVAAGSFIRRATSAGTK
ncbi:MAG: asparagine synthase-related protein [Pseudomonadota bacterium]|nr:asparagine synthase-related protein [Pseudomonadota bacterium]